MSNDTHELTQMHCYTGTAGQSCHTRSGMNDHPYPADTKPITQVHLRKDICAPVSTAAPVTCKAFEPSWRPLVFPLQIFVWKPLRREGNTCAWSSNSMSQTGASDSTECATPKSGVTEVVPCSVGAFLFDLKINVRRLVGSPSTITNRSCKSRQIYTLTSIRKVAEMD